MLFRSLTKNSGAIGSESRMQFDAVAEWQYTSAGDPAAICCCSCSFEGTRILSRRFMLDQTGPCASNTANRVDAFNRRARNRSDFRAPTPSRRGPGKHSLCNSCYAEYFRPATGNTHNTTENQLSNPMATSPVSPRSVSKKGSRTAIRQRPRSVSSSLDRIHGTSFDHLVGAGDSFGNYDRTACSIGASQPDSCNPANSIFMSGQGCCSAKGRRLT